MPERDDFYVGFLAMPRSHRRFLQVALPLTLLAMLVSAAAIALTQRDPGDATWQTGEPSSWHGIIRLDPYPRLQGLLPEPEGSYLLVRMGKFGAYDIAEPFKDQLVNVRGRLLERDGRRMIELDDAPGAPPPIANPIPGRPQIQPPAEGARGVFPFRESPQQPEPLGTEEFVFGPPPAPVVLGPIDIRGEILDAKCYLGAMKPGDGKAHKACAILCISAGIPPMLYSRAADGSPRYHVLIDADGTPLDDAHIALAGEPVRVTGVAETRGDLPYIRVTSARRD